MSKFSQEHFAANWNAIANKLIEKGLFEQLPKLKTGLSGGSCGGFAYVLAECVSQGEAEKFHDIYQFICTTPPADVVDMFDANKNNRHSAEEVFLNELITFIYKVYILQEKQSIYFSNDTENESQEDALIRTNINKPNHDRLGNVLGGFGEDMGEISEKTEGYDYDKLPDVIGSLDNNEAMVFGIREASPWGDHAVTVYYTENKYYIFDPNMGKKVTVETKEAAAHEIIYCANQQTTEGTNKFSAFDRLWARSNLFKVAAVILFPVTFLWILYDVCMEKPLPKEKLSEKALLSSTRLTWSRIKDRTIKPTSEEKNSNDSQNIEKLQQALDYVHQEQNAERDTLTSAPICKERPSKRSKKT